MHDQEVQSIHHFPGDLSSRRVVIRFTASSLATRLAVAEPPLPASPPEVHALHCDRAPFFLLLQQKQESPALIRPHPGIGGQRHHRPPLIQMPRVRGLRLSIRTATPTGSPPWHHQGESAEAAQSQGRECGPAPEQVEPGRVVRPAESEDRRPTYVEVLWDALLIW